MNNSRIEILETMAEIVGAIKLYQRHIAGLNKTIKNYQEMGLSLDWAQHKKTIYEMVINRLEQRYGKQLGQLVKLHYNKELPF